MKTITHERLRELVSYDETAGLFRWRNPNRGKAKAGELIYGWIAGYYLAVGLDKKRFYLHRLVWFYHHGKWPQNQLDHINCNKLDNRIENLRESTPSQNGANMHGRNRLGMKGVYYEKRSGRYYALICRNYKQQNLGTYDTPEEAAQAYKNAAEKEFGEFARTSVVP